jgi:chromosome partitioning protein
MGTVYAIANQKGGVGKTTTAVNVGACIAEAGYRTLLVDVDPQANATVGLGLPRSRMPGLYEVLTGVCTAQEALAQTMIAGLQLLPAGPGLAGANVELPRLGAFEGHLRESLAPIRGDFEYILLDCPPSLGPLTVSALVAADRVIVPVQTEYFALEGLAGVLETLELVRRDLNPGLTVAGMLLTMHDGRTRLGRDVEREVREHFRELVFRTVIPRNVRVGEAPSYGLPVTHHDPHSMGAEAYFELAKEVAARGGADRGSPSGGVLPPSRACARHARCVLASRRPRSAQGDRRLSGASSC